MATAWRFTFVGGLTTFSVASHFHPRFLLVNRPVCCAGNSRLGRKGLQEAFRNCCSRFFFSSWMPSQECRNTWVISTLTSWHCTFLVELQARNNDEEMTTLIWTGGGWFGSVVTRQCSCCTSGPVTTGMGNHLPENYLPESGNVFQLLRPCITAIVMDMTHVLRLKVGFHYPSSRAEFTGRVDGPRTRVHFWHPVNSGRELG